MPDPYQDERQALLHAFGQNVRRARQKAGLSQRQFTEKARTHRTTIGYIEQARREPNLSTLMILADTLGTTIDQLLDGIPVPQQRRPHDYRLPTGRDQQPDASA